MAVHYRTQGFILGKTDRREADRFFTIYTKDFGRLEILAKAVRKIKSKLRPGAELFYLAEVEFIQGKTYKTLTDTILIKRFGNIRNNLEKLKIAYQIAEATNNLIRGQEEDQEVWALLSETFNKLNSLELRTHSLQLIYHYFLWNLFSILGYQIDLYNCPICQKKLFPQQLYFNPKEGGIIDWECLKKAGGESEEIDPNVIKILRLFLQKDWQILSRLKIDSRYQKSLELISESYLSFFRVK